MEKDQITLFEGRLTVHDRRFPRYSGQYWLTAHQEIALTEILDRQPIASEAQLNEVRDWIDRNGSVIIDFEPRP